MSDKEAVALTAFVENGRVLVADYLCGIFDKHGRFSTRQKNAGRRIDYFFVTRDLPDSGMVRMHSSKMIFSGLTIAP